ncbi:hypothetical protein [Flavobacterium sp.]|jgi:hypothetical protein|uniref:hypothetical protein n=1 Tax=Flavobacterium sp. TaxID=239 RepID=UPI0037BF58BF
MIKKIIVSICLLFSLVSFAQEGTSSPYSFYGIGDVRFKGTIENVSMGGMSVIPDSIHMNIVNPAMYSSLKLTTYAIGGTFSVNNLKTNSQNEKAQRTALDYLAIGVPLNKMGIGFGLIPYSSVGYNIKSSSTDVNSIRTDSYDNGNGGVNKVFLGFGYQLTKDLSIGADVQYNFGEINTQNITIRNNANGVPIQYASKEVNTSIANGVNFNMGLSYKTKINNKLNFFSSATYSPEAKLNLGNTRTVSLVQTIGGLDAGTIGDPVDITVPSTKLKLPTKFTLGFGIGDVKKWSVGSEVTFQNTSNFGNRFSDISNVSYENSTRFTFGGYYIPNYKSFSNYFSRVVYRGGFRYENTGLIINGTKIMDGALTLGLGMPLKGAFSNVNIGFELGNRGTKSAGLVREHYMNFKVGLSLNDRWFVKRKYD